MCNAPQPMRISILYFAAVRDAVGRDEESLELPAEITTIAALSGLIERSHPQLAGRLRSCRFAIDEEFASDGDALRDGAVIAVIPPVAGG